MNLSAVKDCFSIKLFHTVSMMKESTVMILGKGNICCFLKGHYYSNLLFTDEFEIFQLHTVILFAYLRLFTCPPWGTFSCYSIL